MAVYGRKLLLKTDPRGPLTELKGRGGLAGRDKGSPRSSLSTCLLAQNGKGKLSTKAEAYSRRGLLATLASDSR